MLKSELNKLKISVHARERYTERIMDKEDKLDKVVFMTNNENKIREDIIKMIEYGTLLYSGKSVSDYNKQPVDVYLNGTWVIIVDPAKLNVVTLFSIDLGLGLEFNHEYINKLLDKLAAAREAYADADTGIQTQVQTYTSLIEENVGQINEYKQIIKALEQQNEGYREVIEGLESDRMIAEKDIRDVIATFLGKKVF